MRMELGTKLRFSMSGLKAGAPPLGNSDFLDLDFRSIRFSVSQALGFPDFETVLCSVLAAPLSRALGFRNALGTFDR